MNTQSDLKLYDHVDFLDSASIPRMEPPSTCSKARRNNKKTFGNAIQRKKKPTKPCINKDQIDHQLGPFEQMFFSPNYDPTPLNHQLLLETDSFRRKNYLNKINEKSQTEKRQFRAERDLRYLHKNAENQSNSAQVEQGFDEESKLFCVHHLIGRCNQSTCSRIHQMRTPRLLGVCKFFLTNTCTKGEACEFMHSEFPCRYYYLDLKHPDGINENDCQFKHGGPLHKEMQNHFRKHIEFWVKKSTSDKPHEFEQKFDDFIDRFDTKQFKLVEEQNRNGKQATMIPKHPDEFKLEIVLTKTQPKSLKSQGIGGTLREISGAAIDVLLDCGLTMDQIYKITTNTDHETKCHQNTGPIEVDENRKKASEPLSVSYEKAADAEAIPFKPATETKSTDERTEDDVNEHKIDCDTEFKDLLDDLEMSDDSNSGSSDESKSENNLVINENDDS